jgi:uncharacterized metal-binding protein YceD (DUF177 family)
MAKRGGTAAAGPAGAPEITRPVRLDRLAPSRVHPFEAEADAGERAALARLIGALAVDRFRFAMTLRAGAGESWLLDGTLDLALSRPCVVTLRPVEERLTIPVRRRFVPMGEAGALDIDPGEDDEVEPLTPRIDLGLVAIEAAVLALDPYPRHPEAPPPAGPEAPGQPAAETPAPHPFAALAALKPGGDGGS